MSAGKAGPGQALPADRALELVVARVLTVGTYVSVACLVAGVVAMAASGIPPLTPGAPSLDPGRLVPDVVGLRPAGFLWLGLVVAIAMPAGRVAASLVGFLREHDRRMSLIALAILGVICLSVALGMAARA